MERDWEKEWEALSERERETFTRYQQLQSEVTAVCRKMGHPDGDLLDETETAMELWQEAKTASEQFIEEYMKSH